MLKDAWTVAIETLSWMEMQKLSEHLALARTIKQLGAKDPNAIRYAYGLVVNTTRRRNLIDKFVNTIVSPKKISEYNLGIQAFLRLYVYQTRVQKNWGKINLQEAQHIASLGRAILGWQTLREVEPILGFLLTRELEPILKSTGDEERVSLETFHPSWYVKYCYNLMGRSEALAFLQGSMKPPPTYIRINTLAAPEEAIIRKLEMEDVKLEKMVPLKHTYQVLETKQPLNALTSYTEGLFYIQDKASCFAAEASDPKQGSVVLDVCAAPGAKTTYLAQLMQNNGAIYSVDFSSRRMQTWKRETARMRTKIAEPIIADACVTLPFSDEADLVVLDPPCTGTGIFAKQPSAKWRISPRSIDKMAEIQWNMIN
ncbi:MAG TPA: RsmB/NOP family class I SAM-dependent RNA methyltransferase, partial [Candidatus Limnocylindrales bacterium]|nr:RsmB/NOP family class I SAM-dependent RNA methyltransferase [Candidatus Limnocylindrales bacterium]